MADPVSPYLNRPLRTEAQARADRLETTNAALLEALEKLAELGEQGMKPDYGEWLTFHDKVAQIARAAITRAKEG